MSKKANTATVPSSRETEDQELVKRFNSISSVQTNDPDVIFEDAETRTYVDAGQYDLEYVNHAGPEKMWNDWRMTIYFRIVSGDFQGVVLPRYYNLTENRNGKAVAGKRSLFAREMKRLFGVKRLDRINVAKSFCGRVVVGEVSTVDKDHRKEPLDNPYSKINALHEIKP